MCAAVTFNDSVYFSLRLYPAHLQNKCINNGPRYVAELQTEAVQQSWHWQSSSCVFALAYPPFGSSVSIADPFTALHRIQLYPGTPDPSVSGCFIRCETAEWMDG